MDSIIRDTRLSRAREADRRPECDRQSPCVRPWWISHADEDSKAGRTALTELVATCSERATGRPDAEINKAVADSSGNRKLLFTERLGLGVQYEQIQEASRRRVDVRLNTRVAVQN